ncbi:MULTISPECIES: RHS repeat-associated core domain-containing protein [unclassified Rhodanobacter]|uniref:RHS repeat-associated core domain-containing protein n=1 Tax=unclassified Rhodanobacter TaxID=2621553 RepID=UPI001BDDDB8F|nr:MULTISPECIES: RHS repeat-associated core domain-containing protein [unclassified Rhodanobacter]MBT2143981.1 RHS repeat-associated core domain-containing protein [Rhodanobacter sp. LX-99]MBT2146945.1 RHS repeat-associated core domain-containing protein [Rhodanobacter sp. LX-100]
MPMKKISSWLTLASLWLCAAVTYAGTVTYVYTDPQGTPLAEADASGNITARFEYTPYGVSVPSMGAAPNGVGYTGHVSDPETGLVYMQARYYDAEVGRFLSVDPVGPSSGDGFGFNRYAYVNNNPYTFIDPDGRQKTVAWLVRLTADGMQGVARLTREQAIRARRAEQNIVGDRRQISSGVERAAHGSDGQLKHVGHELKDGSKGLPHYQTEGKTGHSFWGKVSVVAASFAGALNQAAEAAEYIPDIAPRPATQDDIARTNNIINVLNDALGMGVPNYPNPPQSTELPLPPPPEESKPDPDRAQ